ncbi:MAG: adenylosuccinate lyase [Chloroflexi bacterium RBG_16_48_7]|nr:MAG: adenylosuccinate lyase [Chloroflexi bacterium RBG_16_48_7]
MIERYSRPQMKKVWSEQNKFDLWLKVEIAACEAWAELGKIPKADITRIKKATYSLDRVNEILKVTHHDMTAFTTAVSESLGPESRFIHLGLTSSDVMDTALSLQMKDAAAILRSDIKALILVLENKAIEYKKTMMMGRTHGVHAEPITFGLKMALWDQEMKRNLYRLDEAVKVISVGKISGAVGTYATVPPEVEVIACKKLKLEPAPVSNQVLQRDRHAQFVSTLAIIAASLEKFATEIRALQKTEVLEAEEPFSEGQTGSSAMPHKRNPELCERVCGLARLIRGFSITAIENVALWHERDISHSSNERITLPDSCLALDYILGIFTSVMQGLNVYPENMKRNLEVTQGLIFSQRVLLALIDKGISRKQAYEYVQRNGMKAWKDRTSFLKLLKADKDVTGLLSAAELTGLFDYNYFLKHVDEIFDRLGLTKKRTLTNKTEGLAPKSV